MLGRNLIPALTNDRQWDSPEAPPFPPPFPSMHDPHDTPLSPLSQSSSGYFSTSVSTATLSDASAVVSDSAPRDPSPATLEAGGPETTLPRNSQQRADRNGLLASSQYEAKMATTGSPASQNPSNHSSSLGQRLVNSFQPAPVDEGGFGGGRGRRRDSLERLEIILDDEDGGRDYTLPDWLTEGACVTVGTNKGGTVRYLGNTEFAHGVWVGVELDLPSGVFACMREKWKERCLGCILFVSVSITREHQCVCVWCISVTLSEGFCASHLSADIFSSMYLSLPLIFFPSSPGKNDGSVGGHHYFHCKPGFGVLVRPDRVFRRERSKQNPENRHVGEFYAPGQPVLRRESMGAGKRGENRKSWSN